MKIYVDMDGTVLSNKLDNQFRCIATAINMAEALLWYADVYVDDLQVNTVLLGKIATLKAEGHEIIGWTNRDDNKQLMTERNLGIYLPLFDTIQYHAGDKRSSVVSDGIVYDNEAEYVAMGAAGSTLVTW